MYRRGQCIPTCTEAQDINMFGKQAPKMDFKAAFSNKQVLQILSSFIMLLIW